jgi:adenylylsulfate kinase
MKFNNHKKWWMFPGRWQPLHKGHMAIIDKKLQEDKNIWIAIRETEISENNPYNCEQRMEMIKRAYGDLYGTRVIATVIPDIEGIAYGRGVGYAIEELDVGEAIKEISATKIRNGECDDMNSRVADYLDILNSTVWFTGLPCSGKTTLCIRVKQELENRGYSVKHLDGDDVRTKLCEDLKFSPEDRRENLRRISHVCNLFNENNTIVLASFVSPTNDAREIIGDTIKNLKWVYVNASAEECARRDVKGMWAKAKEGIIPNFTGYNAPFDEPVDPNITLDTDKLEVEECVDQILEQLNI